MTLDLVPDFKTTILAFLGGRAGRAPDIGKRGGATTGLRRTDQAREGDAT
jgi:hypothetical protein